MSRRLGVMGRGGMGLSSRPNKNDPPQTYGEPLARFLFRHLAREVSADFLQRSRPGHEQILFLISMI
jgi:hypothetical protein